MKNLIRKTAWLYDLDHRDNLRDDIPFYLNYAKQLGGTVLDLGCGTGRVSLPLARAGFAVTGLDLSKEMLSIFRDKLGAEPDAAVQSRVEILHGNMTNFQLKKRFSLIIAPFRVFQVLTEDADIATCLRCVKAHLAENGRFIVNAFKPNRRMDASWCFAETVQWERLDEGSGNYVVKKHGGDRIDTQKQIIYPHFAYEITEPSGKQSRWVENLQLKYYEEKQLEEVLANAGLHIYERFGWYDKQSIAAAQRELIFVCGRGNNGRNHKNDTEFL